MNNRKGHQSHGGVHTLEWALYHAVHDFKPGGLPVVASLMDVNAGTLRKKLDTTQETHNLRVEEVQKIIHITKDKRVLDSIGSEADAIWLFPDRLPSVAGDMDLLGVFNDIAECAVEYTREFQESLKDGDISGDEKARLRKRRMRLEQAAYVLQEVAKQFEKEEVE